MVSLSLAWGWPRFAARLDGLLAPHRVRRRAPLELVAPRRPHDDGGPGLASHPVPQDEASRASRAARPLRRGVGGLVARGDLRRRAAVLPLMARVVLGVPFPLERRMRCSPSASRRRQRHHARESSRGRSDAVLRVDRGSSAAPATSPAATTLHLGDLRPGGLAGGVPHEAEAGGQGPPPLCRSLVAAPPRSGACASSPERTAPPFVACYGAARASRRVAAVRYSATRVSKIHR